MVELESSQNSFSGMSSSEQDGLLVEYDEETGNISLEWDPDTHPEYNYLEDLTSEEFSNLLLDYVRQTEERQSSACEIQARGSSGGEAESNRDSGAQSCEP